MRKTSLISMALLLGLAIAPAFASNNLVQLDFKKSSNDSVDVTLVTSDQYNDNVLVRKKSDNKYVILIPKVQSSGFNNAGLNGVKDLVSNIDVKTVDDTSGGYTKVTLITTKPIDIKMNTKKSQPLTAEQKEYNSLMAQANSIKKNIAQTTQKTEVTVNKAPAKEEKPKIVLNEITPNTQKTKPVKPVAKEKKLEDIVPQTTPVVDKVATNKDMKDIAELPKPVSVSVVEEKPKEQKDAKFPFGFLLVPLFILLGLARRARNSNIEYQTEIQPSESVEIEHNDKYDGITGDNSLSWQEKYQMYVSGATTPIARAENKGQYLFIKKPVLADELEQKRQELEKLVADEFVEQIELSPQIVEAEDEIIHRNIKFKAFEPNAVSLKMTNRKSRFKKYEIERPLREQKTIELDESPLYSNQRSFQDANLKIEDVDSSRIKYEPKEYIMSSVDEYLSIIDKEEAEKSVVASEPITTKVATTPLEKKLKDSYLKGLIVKSGFNIDENKGFYLINKDGQNALVGKINNEVFMLKKFDSNISNPLKVRRDNNNVYMVKAGDFKSLIEVNEDKMGVLIEL